MEANPPASQVLFTPLQQQILSNISGIMAMATIIGGVFVNIYILNSLSADVAILKKESVEQSKNIAVIMDRLGIKEQSAAKVSNGLAAKTNAGPELAEDKSADESAKLQVFITQQPTPTPTDRPGRPDVLPIPSLPTITPIELPLIKQNGIVK